MTITAAPHGFDRWAEVLDLLRSAFAYMEGRIDPPSSLTRLTLDGLRDRAATDTVLLACDGRRIVGCAFLSPRDGCLWLGKVAVAGSHRRRGLARALTDRAATIARDRGLAALELQVRIELAETRAAWAALGFAEVARTAHPGFDRPTSITLRRPVAAHDPQDQP